MMEKLDHKSDFYDKLCFFPGYFVSHVDLDDSVATLFYVDATRRTLLGKCLDYQNGTAEFYFSQGVKP